MSEKNMTIIDETDGEIKLQCHCGTEFSSKIGGKRPECPNCGCPFRDEDWEIRRCIKVVENQSLSFWCLTLSIRVNDDGDVRSEKALGTGFTAMDFMARFLPELDKEKVVGLSLEKIGKEEYISRRLKSSEERRNGILGFLSDILSDHS